MYKVAMSETLTARDAGFAAQFNWSCIAASYIEV
jgi:hypothetical protein